MRQKSRTKHYRIKHWFRRFSIYHRLIYTMLILGIVPIILIGSLAMTLVNQTLTTNYVNQLEVTNTLLSKNLSRFMTDIESFGKHLLFSSSTIRQGLQDEMDEAQRITFTREIEQLIAKNYSLLSLASDILILNSECDRLYSQGFKYLDEKILLNQIDQLNENDESSSLTMVTYRNESYLGMTIAINYQNSPIPAGYLFVAISPTKLELLLQDGILNGVESISLVNQDGELITATDNVNLHLIQQTLLTAQPQLKPHGYDIIENQVMSYQHLPYYDWYLVSQTPLHYVQKEVIYIAQIMLFCILSLIVIVSVVSYYLWQSIVFPLRRLVNKMKNMDHEQVVTSDDEEGKDEVSYLYQEFNTMMKTINELIQDIKLAGEKERQLEIKMLQAQINPHFLFNTLNSIRWMAQMSNVQPISDVINALSGLLKSTIVDTNEVITIEQELVLLNNYLTIQKVRFGDDFTFMTEVEPTCQTHPIIKFILQPIVENCLLHGLDEVNDLTIKIEVKEEADAILVVVSDNGKGFDVEEVLRQKHVQKHEGKLSSIGLVNVIQRIQLYYKNEASVEIKSEINKGTTFSLKLPK